jgi:hypothetical protein
VKSSITFDSFCNPGVGKANATPIVKTATRITLMMKCDESILNQIQLSKKELIVELNR